MPEFLSQQFVRLRPDLSGFRAEAQREIAGALTGLRLPSAAGAGLSGALGGLVGANTALAAAQGQVAASGLTAAEAEAVYARSLRAGGVLLPGLVAGNLELAAAQQGLAAASARSAGSLRISQGLLGGLRIGTVAQATAFGALAGGAFLGAQALRAIVSEGATLEARLNELRVVSGATEAEMSALGAAARDLGADVRLPAVSASDAASAMTELAKAGLDVNDTLAGTRGVLELASAAGLDMAQAAEIAASALNAFRLPGEDAVRVADLLAGASIEAQGAIADFGLALQQSAAASAQVGVPIDDAVTALTLLAKAGISGSDAGTSLRTTLLRLVPTTKEAADVIAALGISVADQEGRLLPLADIFDQYRIALAKLPPVTRQAALTTIFGTDAFRAASVFAERGARGFDEIERAITREGIAAEVAGAKAEGLLGATAGLGSASETLAATLSRATNPAIEDTARTLTDLVVAADLAATSLADLAGVQLPGTDLGLGEIAKEVFLFSSGLDGVRGGLAATRFAIDKFSTDISSDARATAADIEALFAKVRAGGGGPTALNEAALALQKMAANLAQGDEEAKALGKRVEALLKVIQDLGALPPSRLDIEVFLRLRGEQDLDRVLKEAQAAGDKVTEGFALAGGAIRDVGLDMIAGLEAAASPAAKSAGKDIGKALVDGMAGHINADERRAINAARRLLEGVRREGDEQIREAIRSARENFESLGNTLGDQLASLIDIGPIGEQIAKIERALDRMQENVSRRRLRFDLTEAEGDLKEAQQSIAQVGKLTPEQRRSQDEFLKPFREKVLDAKAAVKEFTLDEHREDLEKTLEKQKRLAEDGLVRLIERFQDGKLSVSEFDNLLTQRLGPSLDTLRTKAGKNLGLQFERDFLRNVEVLRKQAEALAGFLGRPGTEPGARAVRPADTVADVQAQIRDAQLTINQTIKDAKKQAHDDAGATQNLLRTIERALRGRPTTTTPGTSSR